MNKDAFKKKLLQDLEIAYEQALERGNLTAAIKAKELLAREYGFLENEKDKRSRLSELYRELSEGEIEEMLLLLQESLGGEE